MTEAVQVALITNVTIIIVAIVSRWLSSKEHKETAKKVADTNKKVTAIVNGGGPPKKGTSHDER